MRKKLKSKYSISGKVRPILRDVKTGKIKWIGQWVDNLIPIVGLRAAARRYANVASVANEGAATYGAVGTGSTTPVISDTQMESELERSLTAIRTESNQVAHIETFFSETEANGTITKFALFGEDASAAADSGTMMEYAVFASSFTKTSNETLTIEIDITVS